MSLITQAFAVNYFRGSREELLAEIQKVANRRSKEISGWTYKTTPGHLVCFTTSGQSIGNQTQADLNITEGEPYRVFDENRPSNVRSWTTNRNRS